MGLSFTAATADNEAEAQARPPLAYAFGGPVTAGRIRAEFDDFIVDEQLGFEPSGDGEHVFLKIEKRGENTDHIARRLAEFAQVAPVAIGYAGLKDRNATTTQWFSVHLPGKEAPDWRGFASENTRVLRYCRHNRKLKKGALAGNRFQITIRDLSGHDARLAERLSTVAREGVPNYFGPQRFGRDGHNVAHAMALFRSDRRVKDRHTRGLYLSAARSHLFNRILSERVEQGCWNRALAGDAMMLNGTRRYFKTDALNEVIQSRVASGDIHPTGPLWGRGQIDVSGPVLELESRIADANRVLSRGLEHYGAAMARRALRLPLADTRWTFPDDDRFVLSFSLPAGGYATTVLREIIHFD